MRNKIAIIIFCFCFLIGIWSTSSFLMTSQEDIRRNSIENYLRTAKIVSLTPDPKGGRMAGWIISLADGKMTRHGYFKYIDHSRPHPLPDSYKYEIAAYELNKLLELNIVPPVVEREIKNMKGSLQVFIENAIKEITMIRRKIEPPDLQSFRNAIQDIKIFESLVYDECHDTRDTLIQEKNWKVWRIDFSEAFSPSSELIPGCEITGCSKKIYQNLLNLDSDVVKEKLKPYLSDDEMKTLLKRKDIILEKIKQLIKEKGEESVLFL
ncbi:MAG: hypothetical protein ACETWK_06760 [Candidatus Aminicenantaceae bacterium]